MSEVSRISAELEAIETQRAELLRKLEHARAAEQAAEIEDIRKRIIAFNISPQQLFPELKVPAPRVRVRRYEASKAPAVYEYEGNKWHGKGGPKPRWLQEALAKGVTLESMRIAKPNSGAST